MNKKVMTISCLSIILMLSILNIYLYKNNKDVNMFIEQSNIQAESMLEMSKFKVEINKMAQAQKLYLLTSKKEYKDEFNSYISSIYLTVDELERSKKIDINQKESLIKYIKQFQEINDSLIEITNKVEVSTEVEQIILQLNEAQINLLSQFEATIEDSKNIIEERNNIAIENTDTQVNGVQAVSTVITGLTTVFLYLFRKGVNKESVEKLLGCIDSDINNNLTNNSNNSNPSNYSENVVYKKNVNDHVDIDVIKKEIKHYDGLLRAIKLLYKENHDIKYNIDNCSMLISQIDKELSKLKIEVEECSESSKSSLLRIQKQFIDLRISYEALPIYNKLTLDIYNIIIYDKKN